MYKDLSHLTDIDINELMERYYDKENVSSLIKEFKLNIHPSKLFRLFPPIVYNDLFCMYCTNTNLIAQYKSKANYNVEKLTSNIFCPVCYHEKTYYCGCINCREIKMKEQKQKDNIKRTIIKNDFNNEKIKPPSVENLTLEDVIYLLSAVSHSASEDLQFINPFEGTSLLPPLAPTNKLISDIVKHLYAKGFITISALSNPDAFVFNEELHIESFYLNKVLWVLLPNIDINEKYIYLDSIRKIAEGNEDNSYWSRDDINFIWKMIAKHECIEYLIYLLAERNFNIGEIGEKTHLIFDNLLESFSVGQIFNLSWQAVRDTVDYIHSKGVNYSHGKNMFIGAIQRKADKTLAEKWTVKSSKRDFNCRQTVLSSVFFNLFLKLGEEYLQDVLKFSSKEKVLEF